FGLDEESARKAVMGKNWSSTNMNLEEMLMHRGVAHAQAKSSAEMVRQFREFGVPVGDDILKEFSKEGIERNRHLLNGLNMPGGDISEIGLKRVQSPLMEGYVFDKDVADIIDRVTSASTDEGLSAISKAFRWFSTHWRSLATLSPGFHLRNAQSNMFTSFIKNGPAAFDVNSHLEAFVGTMYVLGGKKGMVAKKAGIPESAINKLLNRRIGGRTIEEISRYAQRNGLITRASMGFDVPDMIKQYTRDRTLLQQLNPLSNENLVLKGSREIGSVIESTPKFQPMLTDMKRMLGEGDELTDNMMDWSLQEAKKWWFDYDDLTDAERKIFKNIVPFYCVDTETEVLTPE
ncbi:hypothetical protein LCGC14_3097910, partial [marine sediment metagenome]